MVRFTVWLQLLLVVLILRQSAAASDQCSELQEEISRLKEDLVSMRDLKNLEELWACNCTEQLQTKIDGLKETVDTMNQQLFEKKTKLEATIHYLKKRMQSLKKTTEWLRESQEHVCQYLLKAAKSGDVNTANILFKHSNDNCTDNDENRNTPLKVAARIGHVEVMRVLLEGGADVDKANGIGRTDLHRAAQYGRVEVVRVLLEGGAYLDSADDNATTALHVAAANGHVDVCRLLLELGADVDRQYKWKHTPLHNAERENHLSVMKLLAEWAEDVREEEDDGDTVSDYLWY